MVQDVMQPTMMKREKKANDEASGRLFLTIHVDELLLIGDEQEVEHFIKYMEQKSWKVEKRSPLYQGNFSYLKAQHGDDREWHHHSSRQGAHQGIGQGDQRWRIGNSGPLREVAPSRS